MKLCEQMVVAMGGRTSKVRVQKKSCSPALNVSFTGRLPPASLSLILAVRSTSSSNGWRAAPSSSFGSTQPSSSTCSTLSARIYLIPLARAALRRGCWRDSSLICRTTMQCCTCNRLLPRQWCVARDGQRLTPRAQVIEDSLAAFFPVVVDTLHKWRQFFKA